MIWDWPTRVFHWLLALAVGYAWFAVEILEDMDQHFYAGYSVLGLLSFRLIWGVIGSYHSRFSNFPLSISKLRAYSRDLFTRHPSRFAGHSPLGALSTIAILLVLIVQASTGLFSSDGYYVYGPLNEKVSAETASLLTDIHDINSDIVTAIVVLHLCAIAFYSFYKREPLVRAMLTGNKPGVAGERSVPGWRAVAIMLLCAASVYWLVT